VDNPTGDPVLGGRLRNIRNSAGLSLCDVTARSGGEIRPSTLSAYERGDRALSVLRLTRLADIYGVSVIDLLEPNRTDAPNRPKSDLSRTQ
jgi:transcriptional regulator with XRE-family HTH domain